MIYSWVSVWFIFGFLGGWILPSSSLWCPKTKGSSQRALPSKLDHFKIFNETLSEVLFPRKRCTTKWYCKMKWARVQNKQHNTTASAVPNFSGLPSYFSHDASEPAAKANRSCYPQGFSVRWLGWKARPVDLKPRRKECVVLPKIPPSHAKDIPGISCLKWRPLKDLLHQQRLPKHGESGKDALGIKRKDEGWWRWWLLYCM